MLEYWDSPSFSSLPSPPPLLFLFLLVAAALDLLSQLHKGPTGPLSGVSPTIDYLQNLGKENLDLVLSYSKWVLAESPDDGLRVSGEVEGMGDKGEGEEGDEEGGGGGGGGVYNLVYT